MPWKHMFEWLALPPTLVWGIFTRGLGVLFLISFLSLGRQIVRGAGKDGGMPIARRLAKIEEDFPTWRRFYYFPTLLWLNRSDAMLRLLTLAGLVASCVLIYGGPYSFWAVLTCYLAYLSLDMAIGLIFPWDCLLFECAVLGLFLPPTLPLPELAAATAPAPALAWAYRIALFRVMFGFGKQKFLGSTRKDLAYLKGFLVAQPLPSPLGWYAQKLPLFMLQSLVLFMFVAEIPAPFFVFFPGDLSIACALMTAFLMVGIQAMGSFGYFSLATIVVCVALLDNDTPRQLVLSELFAPGAPVLTNAFVLLHTLGALCVLPFNSWVGQSWHLWSSWYRLPRALWFPFQLFRVLHPFRWLHPYGVFPPNTYPGVKISLLVEVTWDRQTWHEVDFHYSPSTAMSAPKFVAPHHPRGDQAVIYETFGLNPTSLISGMVGPWDPYSYGTQPAANVLVQRIAEGRGADFMRGSVLKAHREAPVAVRLTTIMLEPVSLKEHFQTGAWWKRSYIGPHTPPRELNPHFWEDFLPEPEMWHFEAIFWRGRSKLGRLMERSRAGEDPMTLALEDARALSAADVERFWSDFIPRVTQQDRTRFDGLPDLVADVRKRYEHRELRAFSRLLGRFSALLVARLEPHYLGRGFSPPLPAKTYLHLWMLVHDVVASGKQAYLAAMADPLSLAKRAETLDVPSGLYLLGVFRFEALVFDAQKLRLITAIMPPHDEEAKALIARGEGMTDFERVVARLAERFAGFFDVMQVLRRSFLGPRFDHGYPEQYPVFEQLDSGEVVLKRRGESDAADRAAAPQRV